MRSAQLWRRAAGVADRVGRGAPDRHYGRWLCVDCPREWHEPPFLPFLLPIHIREHRERFAGHAIAWWCWDHVMVEEIHNTGWRWVYDPVYVERSPIHRNGGFPMTQPVTFGDAILGVCLHCKQSWVVTPETANCLTCGRPPSNTQIIPSAGDASSPPGIPTPLPEASPAESVTLPLVCPNCELDLDVTIDSEGLSAVLTPLAPPADEASGVDQPSSPDALAAGPDQPPDASPDAPAEEPAYCPNHPTERLEADGKCKWCAADAEARLRQTAAEAPEPAP